MNSFDFQTLNETQDFEIHGVRLDENEQYVEVPADQASRFGLYRVVQVGSFKELRHLKDFTSFDYAHRAKVRRESSIEDGEVYCLFHEDKCPEPQRALVYLSCSGGAVGDLYLCPTKYQEHIVAGGDDGDICGICC